MPVLEVLYQGALDDEIDEEIRRATQKNEDSASYNPAAHKRNMQFYYKTEREARDARDRLLLGKHFVEWYIR